MASNAAAAKPPPLSEFTKLSPCTLLYRPGGAPAPAGGGDPRLVVVCSWMGAKALHIAKYTSRLQALYPASPILLLRAAQEHFSQRRVEAAVDEDTAAAVAVIRGVAGDDDDDDDDDDGDEQDDAAPARPALLVLAFSNGGTTRLRRLCLDYAAQARPGQPARLPRHAVVFDSAPSARFHYRRGVTALAVGLRGARRWLALPYLHMMMLYWKLRALLGPYLALTVPDLFVDTARVLNARAGLRDTEVRRAYVYSEEDELVDFREVERHAALAEAEGFAVRREKFAASPHVAHARTDHERYWRIVRETWEGR